MVLLAGLLVFGLGDRCGSEQHDHAGGDDKPAPQATDPDPCSAAARYAFVDHFRVERQVGHQGGEHGHDGDRGHKGPTVVSRTFTLPAALPVCIELVNGRGERPWWSRSSAAEIMLDGSPLFFRHEFNKRVGKLLARRNLLAGDHTLTVRLWSKPGSFVDVSVFTSAPVITSVDPLSGHTGTTLTIEGVNLLVGTTTATFGRSSAAQPVSGTLDTVTVTVPAAATIGPITITNALGTAMSPRPFVPLDPDIQDLPVIPLQPHQVTSGGFSEVDLVGDALTLAVSAETAAPIPAGSTAHLYVDLNCDLLDGPGPGRFEYQEDLTSAGVQSGPPGSAGAMSSDRVVFTIPFASLPIPPGETNGTFFWFVEIDTPSEVLTWPLGPDAAHRTADQAEDAAPFYLWDHAMIYGPTRAGVDQTSASMGATELHVLDSTDLGAGFVAEVTLPAGSRLADVLGPSGSSGTVVDGDWWVGMGQEVCVPAGAGPPPPPISPVGKDGCPVDPHALETYDSEPQYDLNLEHVRSNRNLIFAQRLTQGAVVDAAGHTTPETVFVMDSGVDGANPEFQTAAGTSRVLDMFDTYAGVAGEDGRPAVDPAGNANGHGTAVASVIAAGVNGIGRVGVAPDVLIKPIKVFCAHCAIPGARPWSLGLAFHFAGTHSGPRARVANFSGSMELPPGIFSIPGVYLAAQYGASILEVMLASGNVLLVEAAGNCGDENNDTYDHMTWPSGLFLNRGIKLTVAATDDQGVVAGFSAGNPSLDIAAAGVCVSVARPLNLAPPLFDRFDGTSFATPQVAGAAALVRAWAADNGIPDLRPGAIHDTLVETAHPVIHSPVAEGAGLLDALRALESVASPGSLGGADVVLTDLPWTDAEGAVRDLALSPSGTVAYVLRDAPPRLQLYSLGQQTLLLEQAVTAPASFVVADDDDKRLWIVAGGELRAVPLLSLAHGQLVASGVSETARPVENATGDRLYFLDAAGTTASVVDSSDGTGFGSTLGSGTLPGLSSARALVALPPDSAGDDVIAVVGDDLAGNTVVGLFRLQPGHSQWSATASRACDGCSQLVSSRDQTVLATFDPATNDEVFLDATSLGMITSARVPSGYTAITMAARPNVDEIVLFAQDFGIVYQFYFARFSAAAGAVSLVGDGFPPGQIQADAPKPGTLRFSQPFLGRGFAAREKCQASSHLSCRLVEVSIP